MAKKNIRSKAKVKPRAKVTAKTSRTKTGGLTLTIRGANYAKLREKAKAGNVTPKSFAMDLINKGI